MLWGRAGQGRQMAGMFPHGRPSLALIQGRAWSYRVYEKVWGLLQGMPKVTLQDTG